MNTKLIQWVGIFTIAWASVNLHAQDPRLQAVHGIGDPQLSVADVYILLFGNQVGKLEDVGFRSANPMVDAIPITVDVGIAPGSSTSIDEIIESFTVTIESGKVYIAVARGVINPQLFAPNPDGRDISLNFSVTDAGREASSEPGRAQFLLAHAVTDGPTVDLVTGTGENLVNDIAYGDLSPYVSRTPASETFTVVDPSGATLGSFEVDLSAYADSAMVLLLSGFVDPGEANQNGEPLALHGIFPGGRVIAFPLANQGPVVANAIADQVVEEDFAPFVAADLSLVFNDPDTPVLTYGAASDGNTTVVLDGKNLVLSPVPNFSGISQVVVSADDGRSVASDTFQVTVTEVNDPPVLAQLPEISFDEDTQTSLALNDFVEDVDHPDGQLLFAAEVLATPPNANLQITIDPATHVATLSCTPNRSGQFTVAFTVTDPGSLSDRDTVAVAVRAVNDPPVLAGIPNLQFPEDGRERIELTPYLSDVDDNPERVVITAEVLSATRETNRHDGLAPQVDPEDLQITLEPFTHLATFTSTPDSFGVFTVVLTATDPGDSTDTDTLTVRVTPVNDAPVMANLPEVSFEEDGTAELPLNEFVADVDNSDSEIRFSAEVISAMLLAGRQTVASPLVDPEDLQISIAAETNIATFSSTMDSSGVFTVVFTAQDPGDLQDSDTLAVTVLAVNDAPTVVSAIADTTLLEDSGSHLLVADLNGVFGDAENDSLSFSASSDSGLTVVVSGAALEVTPLPDFFGEVAVIVSADDGQASAADTFQVTVTNVNDAPVLANIPDLFFEEDGTAQLSLNEFVADIDNPDSEIRFTAEVISAMLLIGRQAVASPLVDPEDLQISIAAETNIATFSSTVDSSGVFTVAFTARDPGDAASSDTLTVTVTPVNDPPVVLNAIADTTLLEDSGTQVLVADLNTVFGDVDADPLSFSAGAGSGLSATVNGAALAVTPDANFFGTARVIVQADDGLASAADTFQVTVTNVNDPPAPFGLAAPADSFFIDDPTLPVVFLWNRSQDVDGDLLTYTFWLRSESQDTMVSNLTDTTLFIDGSGFWQSASSYRWSVSAFDGKVQVASLDTFVITVPIIGAIDDELSDGIPQNFTLRQNYPNPFNPTTTIGFALPAAADLTIRIFSSSGQLVRVVAAGRYEVGYHQVQWDGTDQTGRPVSSGVYFYQLASKRYNKVRKMLLLK